jgi:hypothetical protein
MGCNFPTEKNWKQKGRGSYVEKTAEQNNQHLKVFLRKF